MLRDIDVCDGDLTPFFDRLVGDEMELRSTIGEGRPGIRCTRVHQVGGYDIQPAADLLRGSIRCARPFDIFGAFVRLRLRDHSGDVMAINGRY